MTYHDSTEFPGLGKKAIASHDWTSNCKSVQFFVNGNLLSCNVLDYLIKYSIQMELYQSQSWGWSSREIIMSDINKDFVCQLQPILSRHDSLGDLETSELISCDDRANTTSSIEHKMATNKSTHCMLALWHRKKLLGNFSSNCRKWDAMSAM